VLSLSCKERTHRSSPVYTAAFYNRQFPAETTQDTNESYTHK